MRDESDDEIIDLLTLRRAVGVRVFVLSCLDVERAGDCFGVCFGSKYRDFTCKIQLPLVQTLLTGNRIGLTQMELITVVNCSNNTN